MHSNASHYLNKQININISEKLESNLRERLFNDFKNILLILCLCS
jgi:hypothetical protein